MRGRVRLVGAGVAAGLLAPLTWWATRPEATGDDGGPRPVPADLRARDPHATPAARRVYALLAGLENRARRGEPSRTVIGQHVELQNERYNASYGDYRGAKQPGYYYKKARDITGRLPGFVEMDLGPGYGQPGWAVGEPRSYSRSSWPSCRRYWGYVDDAVDLALGVWAGLPRPADGSYHPSGTHVDCASGTRVSLPQNGGGPAGIVGFSFHQPYPGSAVKGFEQTRYQNSPAARDSGWFGRVVTPGTAEHQALLANLDYLADHLGYLAEHGVPVLLRPYHEMNTRPGHGFWWAGQDPAAYRKLWHVTYDHLVGDRGLHNLLFVWSPSAWDGTLAREPGDYYPGGRYVDVVGVDDYSDTPQRPFRGQALDRGLVPGPGALRAAPRHGRVLPRPARLRPAQDTFGHPLGALDGMGTGPDIRQCLRHERKEHFARRKSDLCVFAGHHRRRGRADGLRLDLVAQDIDLLLSHYILLTSASWRILTWQDLISCTAGAQEARGGI
ncbi:glycosyl hydrolase [Streptomyces sp. NPDC047061]|uniref:glycoside hydrolase family 26 protein n=1 Tax=Streptomyces sp. NPDC047061 TaxID=3154605 RepID=UPI0033D4B77E